MTNPSLGVVTELPPERLAAIRANSRRVESVCDLDRPDIWCIPNGMAFRDRRDLLAEVDRLRAGLAKLHSWAGVMSLLDEHWPEDIFPTTEDREDRDPGPRIVSLLRRVDALAAENERLRRTAAFLLAQLDRTIEIHDHVVMDTDEDRKLHARAVRVMRESADKARAALDGPA